MVTLLMPVKRVVSIRASMYVSSPGLRKVLGVEALTQPQETRTLEMFTGRAVLLTTLKLWVRVGPRGTEPKSLDSSSNSESAQVAAAAGSHGAGLAIAAHNAFTSSMAEGLQVVALLAIVGAVAAAWALPGRRGTNTAHMEAAPETAPQLVAA